MSSKVKAEVPTKDSMKIKIALNLKRQRIVGKRRCYVKVKA